MGLELSVLAFNIKLDFSRFVILVLVYFKAWISPLSVFTALKEVYTSLHLSTGRRFMDLNCCSR